ncbi:hypothetical protein NQZ68_014253, partial [Dissostichus eleginoides]
MAFGRDTLSITEGSVGMGFSAAEFQTIAALGIFRPPSNTNGTKRNSVTTSGGELAEMEAKLIQLGPEAIPLPSMLLAD